MIPHGNRTVAKLACAVTCILVVLTTSTNANGVEPGNLVECTAEDGGCMAPASRIMYDGNSAAAYADRHYANPNENYVVLDDDCTNFVSQALFAGGLPWVGYGMTSPALQNWWAEKIDMGGRLSPTWSTAEYLKVYLVNYSGAAIWRGGTWQGSAGDPAVHPYTPADTAAGDPIFYDWDGDGTWNHVAIQVGSGATSDGYLGSYIDQHTNSRWHSFWSGWTYNPTRNTTKFGFVSMVS